MKLDAAPQRHDAARDNRFEPAGRKHGNANAGGASGQPQGSAMASAFARVQGLRR
jgi:protein Tex